MGSELSFRWVFLAYYVLLFGITRYYGKRADRAGRRAKRDQAATEREGKGRVIIRRLAGIVMISAALLYVLYPPWMDRLAAPIPTWLRWVGAGLGALSLPALCWIQETLGKHWSRNLQLQDHHELITTGPYRWVRHPMYDVIFAAMMTLSLVSANWLMIGPALAAIAVIYSRIGNEEAMLVEAFPHAYPAYVKRTGKLLPKLRFRQTSEPTSRG
jgi:protein-S-isoprenylcysteine O-methyltransferase Ste14